MPLTPNVIERLFFLTLNQGPAPMLDLWGGPAFHCVRAALKLGFFEALAGGPLGKLQDGDMIQITIDCRKLSGQIDFVGPSGEGCDPEQGERVLARRSPHPNLQMNPELPEATHLWAVLQNASGGTWGGCVYDVEKIAALIARSNDEH